jgi:hypothetical protein
MDRLSYLMQYKIRIRSISITNCITVTCVNSLKVEIIEDTKIKCIEVLTADSVNENIKYIIIIVKQSMFLKPNFELYLVRVKRGCCG